ncbi:MAG: VWA domain-containing protein [Acidiferrobacterales bacterium]
MTVDGYESGGRLVPNLMYFARALRAAGLPIGPGKVLDAIRAVRAVGITNRGDFYWTLHAIFVNRADQRELFDQAFHVFWRNPQLLERMMALVLPTVHQPAEGRAKELSQRLAGALYRDVQASSSRQPPQIEFDAALTWSDQERLQHKDFETMSGEELAQAKLAVQTMLLPVMHVPTRRFRTHPQGARVDMRKTLRAALRSGAGIIPLIRKRLRDRPPPVVILCDISGSMTHYSRILLHFAHTLTNNRERVSTFLFGTRLNNITRYLRQKDVDIALQKVSCVVEDWSGGTRIGHCLHDFNRYWSRRVLAQGAVVLLITDGLDCETGKGLGREMERLHKSCRRLIWLNPLLRYDEFQPLARGIKAILPHVDDFRSVHNLQSLADLTRALNRPPPRQAEGVSQWLCRTQSPI